MSDVSRRTILAGAAAAGALSAVAGAAPTPAFAAAPLAGKQAPGFYRYKVGSFEVTAVTDGTTSIPLPDTYVANRQKAEVNKELAAQFLTEDRATHVYTPVVVNTGQKLVVIDTGLGPAQFEQSKGAVGQFQTNLQAAGIDRNAVDVVIISHIHGDHINGLVGPDNKPAYPNAEVMMSEAEWAFWTNESNASRVPENMRGNFTNVKRVFGVIGNKVTRHEPGKELVPGITAVATPGHTPGHTSHLVTSGNAKVLVQADVTAGLATLFVRNPDWQLLFDADKDQAVQTRKRIYDMAATDRLLVQGFHFPFPGAAYIEKSGNGYRLVPALWNTSL